MQAKARHGQARWGTEMGKEQDTMTVHSRPARIQINTPAGHLVTPRRPTSMFTVEVVVHIRRRTSTTVRTSRSTGRMRAAVAVAGRVVGAGEGRWWIIW